MIVAIEEVHADPEGAIGKTQRVVGAMSQRRIRVGTFRILYEWVAGDGEDVMHVLNVVSRGQVYRRRYKKD